MSSESGSIAGTGRSFSTRQHDPYTELSEIYDRVMSHVDYDSWAYYLSILLRRFGVESRNILEIACGTGSLAIELSRLGYTLTAMDLSVSMLKKAAVKFRNSGLPVRLFASSMKTIPLKCRFDAVICIYDSINYMTERSDFIDTLANVGQVLTDSGVFIFDVCTAKNSELFFSHHTVVENFGDIRYERLCTYDRVKRIQENHFTIQRSGKRFTESHFQRIYRLAEIDDMIASSPFETVARYDDLSYLPGTEESERVHYVLMKRG